MRSLAPALVVVLVALAGCRRGADDAARQRYLEARRAYGAIFARTLDESCPEEPACAGIVAALAGIPADHPDAAEARKVLTRIERARAERDDVPGFLGGEPAVPGPDEVPAFLRERTGAGGATAPADSLPAPGLAPADSLPAPGLAPAGSRPGPELAPSDFLPAPEVAPAGPVAAADDEGTTILIVDGGDADEAPAKGTDATSGAGGDDAAADRAADDPAADDAGTDGSGIGDADAPAAGAPLLDPCADLRAALAKRKDWLARTAAERNTIAHVADPEDHAALLQLRAMARCGEHPDDPDCAPPPIEVDVRDLQVELSRVTREPGELAFTEGQDPDSLPHDPVVHELEGRLRTCEAER